MNDLALQIEVQIQSSGGINNLSLDVVNDSLNRIPMGALNYRYSIEALKSKLNPLFS